MTNNQPHLQKNNRKILQTVVCLNEWNLAYTVQSTETIFFMNWIDIWYSDIFFGWKKNFVPFGASIIHLLITVDYIFSMIYCIELIINIYFNFELFKNFPFVSVSIRAARRFSPEAFRPIRRQQVFSSKSSWFGRFLSLQAPRIDMHVLLNFHPSIVTVILERKHGLTPNIQIAPGSHVRGAWGQHSKSRRILSCFPAKFRLFSAFLWHADLHVSRFALLIQLIPA